jgi:hypothetical protein
MRSLTGMDKAEFDVLLASFANSLFVSFKNKKRLREVGGGRKGILREVNHKLFFILFYLKVYPTYDLAGFIFDADKSRISRWVVHFLPLLEEALGHQAVLPKRKISSLEEFLSLWPEVKDVFIDGTERQTQRPKSQKLSRKRYSGKKRRHTRKNTIVATEGRRILMVSPTKEGRVHDLTQLNKTGILPNLPQKVTVWADKGYQGLQKQVNNTVMVPVKKPKGKSLPLEQKRENKIISGLRIVVEHAINGIKRFGSMSAIYRNRKGQDDQMIGICAGLWNLRLQMAPK